ncbi:MAG: DNA-binding response regulator [Cyanobacteria bacterium J06641_5]
MTFLRDICKQEAGLEAGNVISERIFVVIDDHEALLLGTVPALQGAYPNTRILTAQDAEVAETLIDSHQPELVVVDLSIPAVRGGAATSDVGLQLVKGLLESKGAPNIAVLSTDVNPLVRLKAKIRVYEGGFAAIDKSLPLGEMLNYIGFAMRGSIYLPSQVRSRPEFHPKWVQVLKLRFEEGLTDRAIAKRMGTSDRTIRNYWVRVQDALLIGEDPDLDLRMQIAIEAKKIGLIR